MNNAVDKIDDIYNTIEGFILREFVEVEHRYSHLAGLGSLLSRICPGHVPFAMLGRPEGRTCWACSSM